MKLKNEDLYFWSFKNNDPKSTYNILLLKPEKRIENQYFLDFFKNNSITKKNINLKEPSLFINDERDYNNFYKEIIDLDHKENTPYPKNWYNIIDLTSVFSIIYVNYTHLYFFIDHVAIDGISTAKLIWDFFKLEKLDIYNKLPLIKKKWYHNLLLIQCLKLKRNITLDLPSKNPNSFRDILQLNTVLNLKKKMNISFQVALGSILVHNLFKNLNTKKLTIGHLVGIDTEEDNFNKYSVVILNIKKNDNLECLCKNYQSEFKKNLFQITGNYIMMDTLNKFTKLKIKLIEKLRKKIDVCISIGKLTNERIKVSDNIINIHSLHLSDISFPFYIGALSIDKEILLNYVSRCNNFEHKYKFTNQQKL